MRPIDPRLLRCVLTHTRARWLLLGTVLAGAVASAALLVQAVALAKLLAAGVDGTLNTTAFTVLAIAVCVRTLATSGTHTLATHTATSVKSHLRVQLLRAVASRGPEHLAQHSRGDLITIATTGVDALDEYFSRYLPALVTAALVPPAVVVLLFVYDSTAALTVAITLPLMPLFAALVGWATQRYTTRQWRTLTALAGHFLDVVHGLTTLAIFDRARHQSKRIIHATQEHRVHTIRTLRLAFLSSGVLEVIATISIALVAVSAGLRLVDGTLGFSTALILLLLTPEAYWPLRNVGAEFHSAHNGVTAADRIFAYDVAPEEFKEQPPLSLEENSRVEVQELAVDGRLGQVSVALPARSVTAVTGRSGVGKTTLFSAILGFLTPTHGGVVLDGEPVHTATPQWREHLAWMPQHAHLIDDTVRRNVREAHPAASDADADAALTRVGLRELAEQPVGERGVLLSSGQRQRVALARLLLRADVIRSGIVLLDEPTAYLDADTEKVIVRVIEDLRTTHRVVVIAHRKAVCELADQVVKL